MMNDNTGFPDGMKGICTGGIAPAGKASGLLPLRKGRLPAYWGIDLVLIPVMIWLTVQTICHWDLILITTARIMLGVLSIGMVLLVLAVVTAVVLLIRNKRIW